MENKVTQKVFFLQFFAKATESEIAADTCPSWRKYTEGLATNTTTWNKWSGWFEE